MKTISPEALLGVSLILACVPLVLALGTCYLKFSIVLSLLRTGFGTQQAPSGSLVMALSVVLSLMVMQPIMADVAEGVSKLDLRQLERLPIHQTLDRVTGALDPWRKFLRQHAGDRELAAVSRISSATDKAGQIDGPDRELSLLSLLGAFVLSEIKRGFVIAFFLLLPFFVIDVVVSNVLVSMGLTMVSPVVVTLPLKLLLFISSDGWLILAEKLIQAYR